MKNTTQYATQDKAERTTWTFSPRYRIEGLLVARKPLHIGGELTTHPLLKNAGDPTEISACVKDHAGMPYIPGATLRGNLRAYLTAFIAKHADNAVAAAYLDIFGADASEDDQGCGGRAEFHDAFLSKRADAPDLPYWRAETQTYVETSNCLDRLTGTSARQKLFYREMVPPDVGFKVMITGNFATPDHVALLLGLMERFNDPDHQNPLALGNDTACGMGLCRWELQTVSLLDQKAVSDWLNTPDRSHAATAMQPLAEAELAGLRRQGGEIFAPAASGGYIVPIDLNFTTNFLVNNPLTEEEAKLPDDSRPPNHRPLLNNNGEAYLPAKSFRGAFRGRAEKIVRTLGAHCCDTANPSPEEEFCTATGPCEPIHSAEQRQRLCPVCLLLGGAGWKTPIAISDFTLKKSCETMPQEFVAIDRFTGGGKDGAKFNAESLYQPQLEGHLQIDFSRLPGWGLGLLVLVLRDLLEGDITFGFGAAKGYGACEAFTTRWDEENFRLAAEQSLDYFYEAVENDRLGRKNIWGSEEDFRKTLELEELLMDNES